MRDYPEGFHEWPLDKRNAWFELEVKDYALGEAGLARAGQPLPLAPAICRPRQFPVTALGDVLAAAAEAISEKCQCAPALAAQSVLAVASLASQRIADVQLPFGQTRPVSLYFVTIAASGDRKSTTDNEALIPVRMHEKNLKRDYATRHEAWRISNAAWAAQHKKIENERKVDRPSREVELSALGPAPQEPVKPLLTAPEPTVEALAKHWPALPGSLGLFSAEGGQMMGGHGFGPDHRLKTAAALSTLWDGGGIRRLRAGDGISDLPGRRLALHLMVQPAAAAAFLSEPILRNQGLLSRLLIAAPQSLAGARLWKDSCDSLDAPMGRYVAVILNLLERPAPAANAAGNELTPRVLALSAQAKAVWVFFHDRIRSGHGSGRGSRRNSRRCEQGGGERGSARWRAECGREPRRRVHQRRDESSRVRARDVVRRRGAAPLGCASAIAEPPQCHQVARMAAFEGEGGDHPSGGDAIRAVVHSREGRLGIRARQAH